MFSRTACGFVEYGSKLRANLATSLQNVCDPPLHRRHHLSANRRVIRPRLYDTILDQCYPYLPDMDTRRDTRLLGNSVPCWRSSLPRIHARTLNLGLFSVYEMTPATLLLKLRTALG
nr:unnamed protein product [Haemonchus contortus]